MRRALAAFAIAAGALAGCAAAPAPAVTPAPAAMAPGAPAPVAQWKLVFSDEFDGPAIDRSKWDFDVDCWGGGNNERQCYTDSPRNAAIDKGQLVITARREQSVGPALPLHMRTTPAEATRTATKPFSSARLVTRGLHSWRYGKIEVRARLPQGQGVWPAIWMLPEHRRYGTWAASGEIDILEAVNLGVPCKSCPSGREDRILGTLHFGGQWPANRHKGDEVSFPQVLDGGFHDYAIVWEEGRIRWYFDGQLFSTRVAGDWFTSGSKAPAAPFDEPFHLLLNLAIGGGLAEDRGLRGVADDIDVREYRIDWVRVWQCDGQAATGRGCQ